MEKKQIYELFDSLLKKEIRKEETFENNEELERKEHSGEKQNDSEKANSTKLSGKKFEINLRSTL